MGKGIREDARAQELEPVSLSGLIHQQVRIAIETAVHEELRAALGTTPYERSDVRRGYRNGTKVRTLTGPTGPVALTLPRATLFAGAKEWTSRIVPRYHRRMPEVNEAVVATYLAGGNTRRIRGALQPLLKTAPLSKSAVSRVIATLKDGLEAWRTRSLAELDVIYVYVDGFALRVRSAGKVVSVPVLGVVGVLPDGHKHLVALELCGGGESFAAWKGCLDDLVARGLRAPILVIVDGNAGLRRVVGDIWPRAAVQRCCVHKLRNLERKATQACAGRDPRRLPSHRVRGQCRCGARCLRGLRAHVGQALPGSGDEPARRQRGASHVLPVPESTVEDVAYDKRDRAAPRRISPTREDPRLPPDRGRRTGLTLQSRGQRSGQVAQDRRLEETR